MASGAGSRTQPRGEGHFSVPAHGAKFFWVVMISVPVLGSLLQSNWLVFYSTAVQPAESRRREGRRGMGWIKPHGSMLFIRGRITCGGCRGGDAMWCTCFPPLFLGVEIPVNLRCWLLNKLEDGEWWGSVVLKFTHCCSPSLASDAARNGIVGFENWPRHTCTTLAVRTRLSSSRKDLTLLQS